MVTVSTQLKSISNCHPLIPQSEDPSDFSIITPGHFLIEDSLTCEVELNLSILKVNLLGCLQIFESISGKDGSRNICILAGCANNLAANQTRKTDLNEVICFKSNVSCLS